MHNRLPFVFAILFALAHTQSPLYYSNQNQYFLSGLADAGAGNLNHDWLANTADPVPVFSAFVAICFKYLGTWPFHIVFFLALVGYYLALWWLVAPKGAGQLFWATLLIVAHAGIVRFGSDRLLGADYPWFLHCGLASQYVLGPGLQPSVVGVLLLASVAAYANGRSILAAGLAAGANLIHATYLVPACFLISGYLVGDFVRNQNRIAGRSALLATVLVLPAVVYSWMTFAPTDPNSFAESQRVLSEIRIPHHTRPARWFDWVAGLQVIWMLLGLLAVRRTRLFIPLGVTYLLVAVGTGLVALTNNSTLSLLFPWRVTAVLIPVSTALIFARAARLPTPVFVRALLVGVVLLCAGGGLFVMTEALGYREPEAENPALQYVAETQRPNELYLVPARFPKPSTTRGVYSNTFAKPPDPSKPVFFEMARFRLFTQAPVYIDFKSIPYRDTEVLEWHRRVGNAERWFTNLNWDRTGTTAELAYEGITHVVAPSGVELQCSRLELLFEGGAYRVYRFRSE
jgi:hypothetical protein